MIVVVDTSVLIDNLRGDPRAKRLLLDLHGAGDDVWSVTVVRTEVLAGMRKGEERTTAELFGVLQWQDVTIEIADRAGQLARQYMAAFPGIDTADYLIAAATEVLRGRLMTRNVKHFPMIAGLEAAYRNS